MWPQTALGVLLVLHGIAHAPGFIGPWRALPLEGTPYHTTILAGRLDLGDAGMRAFGVLWLLLGLAFLTVAVGAFSNASWWFSAAILVTAVSLSLSLLQLPDTTIGVVVNVVVLVALGLGQRAGWFPGTS